MSIKNWSPWTFNEGRISEDEWIEFDDQFKKQSERNINQLTINGTVTMQIGDSFQDFEELFKKFIDEFSWQWNGEIEIKV